MPNVKEKLGYKFTEEFGYIPEDWDVTSLGNIANIKRGASPRPIDSPVWFDSNSNVGWTRISDIKGKYLFSTEQRLSELGIKNSRYVGADNVIMSICATLGRPTIVKNPICIHDGFVCFFDLNQNFEYLYYVLEFIQDSWLTRGQVGSQSNLNTDLINNTLILLPPLSEQEKIAVVLSDIDELIESTQKLIDKKKDLKTATMQKLLVPNAAWSSYKLKELIEEIIDNRGKTPPLSKYGYPLLEIASLVDNKIDYNNVSKYVSDDIFKNWFRKHLNKGDVLISTVGTTGIASYYSQKVKSVIAQNIVALRFARYVNPLFMTYLISSKYFNNILTSIQMNQVQASIKVSQMIELSIKIPDVDRQYTIANILADFDSEIETLVQELNKYKDLKTGMMQELLTGKKRLV